jgi:hypothetical protein
MAYYELQNELVKSLKEGKKHFSDDRFGTIDLSQINKDYPGLLNDVIFEECTFRQQLNMKGISLDGSISFNGSIFECEVMAEKATFKKNADFSNCTFCSSANFNNSEFKKNAFFDDCSFERQANFEGLKVPDYIFSCKDASFHSDGNFKNFNVNSACFSDSVFHKNVDFEGASCNYTGFDKVKLFGGHDGIPDDRLKDADYVIPSDFLNERRKIESSLEDLKHHAHGTSKSVSAHNFTSLTIKALNERQDDISNRKKSSNVVRCDLFETYSSEIADDLASMSKYRSIFGMMKSIVSKMKGLLSAVMGKGSSANKQEADQSSTLFLAHEHDTKSAGMAKGVMEEVSALLTND